MPTGTGARARLIDATITLLRERGVHGTGVAEVLERSGTARGSLYQHFPGGKADLVIEATRSAGGRAAQHVGRTSDGTPSGLLDALVDWWTVALTKHDFGRGCPVAAAALDDAGGVTDEAGRVFASWTDELAQVLAEHRDAAEARRLAGFVISSLEGALLQCRALRSTGPLEDARVVLRSLLSP